jgi:2-polyprenyl-3-methyl-5-hydroxy-6-metoxy-1,4-benzoquinol methylase
MALEERLFGAVLGTLDLHAVYLGDRLGLYRALAEGASTASEVAAATATEPRYVREWLEQQAVTGLLAVDGAGRFALPPGHDDVLLQSESLQSLAPFVRMVVGMLRRVPDVMEAYRTGGGVPYERYDADFCEGQGDMNGAMFDALLGSSWLPAMPDVDARLRAAPAARVADVACGVGRSTVAMARAYPDVEVDGIDIDRHSIGVAQGSLAEAGDEVAGRVTFAVRDAADPRLAGRYDVVTVFEAIHDLSRPVEVLRAVRAMLVEEGTALVADERVADAFVAPGDDVERLMYGYSVLHCLPVGMADQPSAATGTVMRASTLERYAREAGFAEVEVLPIENEFWRFYRLRPTAAAG